VTPNGSVLIEPDGDGVVLVTLNRPEALNAADEELHGALSGWPSFPTSGRWC
jgi:enoyl-CoA hydratase